MNNLKYLLSIVSFNFILAVNVTFQVDMQFIDTSDGVYIRGGNIGSEIPDIPSMGWQLSDDDGDLVLKCDNQSGGTAAYITLDGSTGWTTMNVPIHLIAQGSTPTNPGEGQAVIWLAEDGNINAKITLEEQTSTVVIAAFGGG